MFATATLYSQLRLRRETRKDYDSAIIHGDATSVALFSQRMRFPVLLIVFFSFALGFALSRASTCTVAATTRLVTLGKPDWLIGILVAVCWSAVTLLLLKSLVSVEFPQHEAVPIGRALFIASIIMGIGAYLNGACFIGSVGKISSGELSFLMTFLGLLVARLVTDQWFEDVVFRGQSFPNMLTDHPVFFWAVTTIFLFGFVYGLIRIIMRRQEAMMALCAMGVCAAVVFSYNPNWSYEAWIGRMVNGEGLSEAYGVEMTVLGLFTGATIGGVLKGTFSLQPPRMTTSAFCFLGGLLMGFGAKYAPGGNDTLLLWTIPNFVLYGFVSYLTMVATVALLVQLNLKRTKTQVSE